MARLAFLLICLLTTRLVAAQEIDLRTGDDLALRMSPQGHVTGLRIGAAAVPLHEPGGFFLTDYRNQPDPVNLVPNPGFEQGAEGWGLAAGQTLDREVVHSGPASARLVVAGPEAGSSNLGCVVPVKPGHRYRVGIWMRRHGCGVCGAYASERDAEGKLSGAVTQVGLPVPREDDVWQYASREVQMGPNTTQLSLRADIYRSTGTIWLDDFHVSEIIPPTAERVTGEAKKAEGGAQFTGTAAKCRVEATLKGDEKCLRVDGTVTDLQGEDRAIGLSFRLPLDAAGWTWFDNLEDRRTIEGDLTYALTYNCASAEGQCSIYPWSALTGKDGGLSLALPLSQGPRVFVIDYNAAAKAYEVTFYFGLTEQSDKWPGKAGFSFVLYRHDPVWGMRDATRRYYDLFPESFVKRPTYEAFLNYANLERLEPKTHRLIVNNQPVDDASDFGEGYEFIWHLHGCYDFRMVASQDPKRPSDEVVLDFLNGLVETEKTKPGYYCPTAETIKKLVHDGEGHISYIGDTQFWQPHEGYNHTDQSGWGLNFRVNEDPEVSGVLARRSREEVEKHRARGPYSNFTACLTADAIEGYFANTSGLDYRPEHLRVADLPLTFGKGNLKPAIPNTIWDFLHTVWWPLTQEAKVATYGNANGYEQAFTLPYCDIPMIEWDWDAEHPARFEQFCRMMAYQRIWRFWRACGKGEQDRESVLRHFDRGLAYAIYPAVYPLVTTSGDIETYRALFRQYVPAIEALSRAGWEPIPYARTDSPNVVIERFGDMGMWDLHFTLRNYSNEPTEVTVALDADRLHLLTDNREPIWAYDLLQGPHSAQIISPGGWRMGVPANGARAFWVGRAETLRSHASATTIEDLWRIWRAYSTEAADNGTERFDLCMKRIGSGQSSLAKEVEAAHTALGMLDDFVGTIETDAPVDLAKLVFRTKADLSGVGVAFSGLYCDAPRVVEGVRGDSASAELRLTNAGKQPITDLSVRLLSPWSEAEAGSECACDAARLEPGATGVVRAKLLAFAGAERTLLPYLVQIDGQVQGVPITICVPIDVVARPAIEANAGPNRLYRDGDASVSLRLTNRLNRPLSGSLELGKIAGLTLDPNAPTFSLAAQGEALLPIRVHTEPSVALGQLLLPFRTSGDDPAARTEGSLSLVVTTPVPQAIVRRTSTPISIDGRLDEAVWLGEPTIPRLGLIANGKDPSEATRVWITCDDKGLYLARRCAESNMPGVKAELTQRGAPLYQDDDVEVFLLPPGETAPLQLAINALGTQSDSFGNNAPWQAAAQRGTDEWTVEVFVPYEVLGVKGVPSKGSVLPAQIGRQQKSKSETTAWSQCSAYRDTARFGDLMFQ